jgi:hypothetical protein
MTKNDELAQSIEDLRAEVRELREMVNMLVDIIVNMENDDQGDIENEYFDMNRFDKDPRFSM